MTDENKSSEDLLEPLIPPDNGDDVEAPLRNPATSEPVLQSYANSAAVTHEHAATTGAPILRLVLKDAAQQAQLAWPLVLGLLASYATSVISMSFVGHLGSSELAGAALGNAFVGIVARYVIQGLCGALDTQAAQVYGAGNYAALGPIFKRTVMFMWLHCIPLSVVLLLAPRLLALVTQSRSPQLLHMAHRYIMALIPAVWMDALGRPLNRILVAQRISRPQMCISFLVIGLHIATNYTLIYVLGWGYLGAAAAMCLANTYTVALFIAYIAWAGLGPRVWGGSMREALRGWGATARLAYPACVMKCAESWGFALMTLVAGALPDPEASVAAVSIAFSTCALFYMPAAGFSMATCAQVGNLLGAGDARGARVAALASAVVAPALWSLAALMLLEPHCQAAVIGIFTSSSDPVLRAHLHNLMRLVVLVSLFDQFQTILSGVVSGCGKQRHGMWVNFAAFYVVAVPLALALAFWWGWGAEGLWAGMSVGSMLQAASYSVVVSRIAWDEEAKRAAK